MNLDSVNSVLSSDFQSLTPANNINVPSFAEKLMNEIASVDNKLTTSEVALQDLTAGKSSNIHHVMLALEDAKLSFQLLVQVRNKLLDGYQDILRMQV